MLACHVYSVLRALTACLCLDRSFLLSEHRPQPHDGWHHAGRAQRGCRLRRHQGEFIDRSLFACLAIFRCASCCLFNAGEVGRSLILSCHLAQRLDGCVLVCAFSVVLTASVWFDAAAMQSDHAVYQGVLRFDDALSGIETLENQLLDNAQSAQVCVCVASMLVSSDQFLVLVRRLVSLAFPCVTHPHSMFLCVPSCTVLFGARPGPDRRAAGRATAAAAQPAGPGALGTNRD